MTSWNFFAMLVSTGFSCLTAPVLWSISKYVAQVSGSPLSIVYLIRAFKVSISTAWIFSGSIVNIPARTPPFTFNWYNIEYVIIIFDYNNVPIQLQIYLRLVFRFWQSICTSTRLKNNLISMISFSLGWLNILIKIRWLQK